MITQYHVLIMTTPQMTSTDLSPIVLATIIQSLCIPGHQVTLTDQNGAPTP